MNRLLELLTLFVSAFGAATLFPVPSELTFILLLQTERHAVWLLLLVATVGNVLGAVVNWWLGKYLLHFQDRRWFPISLKHLKKATRFYQRWGVWTLLLAWAPIIGDPLTLVAGIFRAPIGLFLLLVTISKLGRYVAVIWIAG